MEEEWKTIDGFEGKYQVSNLGRVRSVYFSNRFVSKKPQNKILSQSDNGCGYLLVHLGTKKKDFYVHRLVAEYFCENPDKKKCVNHKDYDRKNNRADNLEWTTYSENVLYSVKNRNPEINTKRKSNSGEKYIWKTKGGYKVYIRNKSLGVSIQKYFKTFESALAFRNKQKREIYG